MEVNYQGDTHEDNETISKITQMRQQIDQVDEQILYLLNQRFRLAADIGKLKVRNGRQVIDSARETMVINRLISQNKGPLTNHMLRRIYKEIISASREHQRSHVVTYLGPEATFTHIAAMDHFGRFVTFVPQHSIPDVLREVEKGTCDYGVVPIENSIEGTVNQTLDALFETNLRICGEKYQPISHDLLARSGGLQDIHTVYSHPQAISQCRKWLTKYLPNAALKESSSTARAAQKACKKDGVAAIASSEAAKLYHLTVIASRIQDTPRNTTRFLIMGRDVNHSTGKDKTSIIFVTSHLPGALFKALQPIAENGVNMVKLESRPTRHENWSYFFFVDLEGHVEDANIRKMLDQMRETCLFLKILGSYPRAIQEEGGL